MTIVDEPVKSNPQLKRWLSKNTDIQEVVCLDGSQLYIWYVANRPDTHDTVEQRKMFLRRHHR